MSVTGLPVVDTITCTPCVLGFIALAGARSLNRPAVAGKAICHLCLLIQLNAGDPG
jgi:hypothetical protein